MDDFEIVQTTPPDQPGTRLVAIKGSMSIQYGPEIKAALLEAMNHADTVRLDLREVTEMDLVGLQFVCSTHRAMVVKGKQLVINKAGNLVMEEAMLSAGISSHAGCIHGTENSCAWAGGGM